MQETWIWSMDWEDPLEEGMGIHSSNLAWRIPCTEEPGRLQSMGSQRVGHDWSDWARTKLIVHHPSLINGHSWFLQFSSVAQSCPTLCDPVDYSTPGFPVHHQLPKLARTHVHWVSDAIQPSHPLLSPSPPAFNLSLDCNITMICFVGKDYSI